MSGLEPYLTNINAIDNKLASLEEKFNQIIPKIEHIYGFSIHSSPYLASKADIETAKSDAIKELLPRIDERLKASSFYAVSGIIFAFLSFIVALVAVPGFSDYFRYGQVKAGQEITPPLLKPPAPPAGMSPRKSP